MTTVNYFIPSINCGGCKHRIETWLGTVQGVQSVTVNVATKHAAIVFDTPATEDVIKTFLAKVNYPVQEASPRL
jgi:copper chaperone CopZ